MGQYYHVITEDKDGKREYFNIQTRKFLESKLDGNADYKYYNGLKLMEHSWWGNDFCAALAIKLVDNPKKVCWCGDYSEEDECRELGFEKSEVWERSDGDYTYVDETKFSMDLVKYLVNVDKKIYVNLQEYKQKSLIDDDWCIFPISLLTALGNDRGGGDYHEGGTCFDLVGTWAFDEIYLTNKKPENYGKLNVYFKE